MIGFLPLPTNTENEIHIFGLAIPSFAIYAATANISIPLALTLVVWVSYHVEGIRAKGFFGYLKSWLPPGLEDMNPVGKAAIFVIEVISHFVRLISLSVRLFANILAGHLLLLFMGGGLAVLLGLAALGALTFPLAFAFFIFEVGLIATLQAFIFSTLTAIYLGGATAESSLGKELLGMDFCPTGPGRAVTRPGASRTPARRSRSASAPGSARSEPASASASSSARRSSRSPASPR